jgi:digeranylgeranylglycerophospholipid reductase
MYDVVVVGAGPAGSITAKKAAEKGLKTLLVERELEIGVPDKCGEYLPSLEEMKRLAPKVEGLEELFDPPENCVVNRTKYVRFVFSNAKEITVPFKGVVVERKVFDKHIANEAIRAGAETAIFTKVLDFNPKKNFLKAKDTYGPLEIHSRTVVGADGAYSLIARRAGLPVSRSPYDYGVGYQYEMANVDHDPDYVDMYISEDVAPGTYAWIIPKGDDVANVGTGARAPYMEKGVGIREYLRRFIEKAPLASNKLSRSKPTAVKAGCIPVGGPIRKTFTDKVLLVGDAAGQTIPTVGGGVPPALICGRIAGKVVADHLEEEIPLRRYEENWKKQLGETLENSLRLRKMSDVFFKNNKLIDFVTERGWLSEEMVEKFILCEMDNKMKLIEKTLSLIR